METKFDIYQTVINKNTLIKGRVIGITITKNNKVIYTIQDNSSYRYYNYLESNLLDFKEYDEKKRLEDKIDRFLKRIKEAIDERKIVRLKNINGGYTFYEVYDNVLETHAKSNIIDKRRIEIYKWCELFNLDRDY